MIFSNFHFRVNILAVNSFLAEFSFTHTCLLRAFKVIMASTVMLFIYFCLQSDDYNRVQLTTGNGEAGCDYINASFIDVQKKKTTHTASTSKSSFKLNTNFKNKKVKVKTTMLKCNFAF